MKAAAGVHGITDTRALAAAFLKYVTNITDQILGMCFPLLSRMTRSGDKSGFSGGSPFWIMLSKSWMTYNHSACVWWSKLVNLGVRKFPSMN